ncbi:MAG TPA: glycosyltransferase family 39 protein [Anaerolineales bacterium]|nr:glycosyltransferase family 39 protein [Anaerolineales bacterium]
MLLIYGTALLLYAALGSFLRSPGYMDAEYYQATGQQLAAGRGFQEPFLWNYLDDPAGVPHPSHQYWMPLASLVSAAGIAVFGDSFRGAQIPFLLVAAAWPVLAYAAAWQLYGQRGHARLAAWLAAFPGLFLPFLLTTDTFGLFALTGGGALLLAGRSGLGPRGAALAGALIGMAHWTRADGFLLWAPLLVAIAATRGGKPRLVLAAGLGYIAVMTPWLWRNLADTGRLWPSAGGRTLWLLSYDETFAYPASILTPTRWWSAGFPFLIGERLRALATDARSLLIVSGLVFLAPAMAVGAWRRRTAPLVGVGFAYLVALLVVMSFAFPYAGARGGFFHSSAALAPLFFALVPEGLEAIVGLAVRLRRWTADRALRLFASTAVALAVAFTAWAMWSRLTGNGGGAGWERNARTYAEAAVLLPGGTAAVNDPPGLHLATGGATVAIPDGGEETLRAVVERYSVAWVLLENNHPRGLDGLYDGAPRPDFLGAPSSFTDPDGLPAYVFPVIR